MTLLWATRRAILEVINAVSSGSLVYSCTGTVPTLQFCDDF